MAVVLAADGLDLPAAGAVNHHDLALRLLAPQVWALGRLWITLGAVLGFFVPMVVQAKRYA